MLPVEAEAKTVVTSLPHQALGQLIAASDERKRACLSEHQPGIRNANARSAHAQTARTVLDAGRCFR